MINFKFNHNNGVANVKFNAMFLFGIFQQWKQWYPWDLKFYILFIFKEKQRSGWTQYPYPNDLYLPRITLYINDKIKSVKFMGKTDGC